MNQQSSIFRETVRTEPAAATAATTASPYGTVTPAVAQARHLADRMRAALAAAGFEVERDFPSLRGDTTISDEPFLTLGRLTPAVAEHLLAALAAIPHTAITPAATTAPALASAA